MRKTGKTEKGSDKHGRNGKDLLISVPLGTVAKLDETGEVLQEVIEKKNILFSLEVAEDEEMLVSRVPQIVLQIITSRENQELNAGLGSI